MQILHQGGLRKVVRAVGLVAPGRNTVRVRGDAVRVVGSQPVEEAGVVQRGEPAGGGVALARSMLASHLLESGALVAPFEVSLPATDAFYLTVPEGGRGGEASAALKAWLLAEARASSMPERPGESPDPGPPA